jgi:hypothetical protein
VKFSGTLESAYGKALPTPLAYDAEFSLYENPAELRAAGGWPNDATIVKFVNAQAKANARQKATVATLESAGIVKPTIENDDQMKLREMVKILIAAGKSEDESRTLAAATLGIDWDDEN